MSTAPSAEVEAAYLAALDFDPICEVQETCNGQTTVCTKAAVWLGITPCGHESYFCAQHHTDGRRFTCLKCGRPDMLTATYTWIRL